MDNDAQQKREFIVLTAVRLGELSLKKAEEFDRIVCSELGINQSEVPPEFLFDSGYF